MKFGLGRLPDVLASVHPVSKLHMKTQICMVPQLSGLGGMVSFQGKFIQGLQERQIPFTFDLSHPENTAILVIGGTRQLLALWRAKRHGVPIIQRLNGMNWMHKVEKTPPKAYLRSEMNNRLLAFIRRRLADRIIYQSEFSHVWWDRVFGVNNRPNCVIYNGVDTDTYSPVGPEKPPVDHDRILLVEGHLGGANFRGLETAVKLVQTLEKEFDRNVELMVVGDVSADLIAYSHTLAPDAWITWQGVVPQASIPGFNRSAHLLFSADLNAACPNSVIEALACGCPVAAYDTGALAEIVQKGAGKVVHYGSNHWHLEDPDLPPLAEACVEILQNNPDFRLRAQARAEETFSLDAMVEAYLQVLVGAL